MKSFVASLAVLAMVSAAAVLAVADPARSQTTPDLKPSFYPTRTVTIVVPYSPGGGTDAVGRLMAKELEAMWGQTVLIDNRTGGNGSVGAALVARAPPDGHTMVLATLFLERRRLGECGNASRAHDAQRFEAAGIEQRQTGSDAGNADVDPAGGDVAHERGGALVGDVHQLDAGFLEDAFGEQPGARVGAGESSLVGTFPVHQILQLPKIVRRQGRRYKQGSDGPGDRRDRWPAGTPPSVVEAIQQDIAKVLATPAFQAKLVDYGALPAGPTPAAFTERFQRDLRESGETIRRLGMTAD